MNTEGLSRNNETYYLISDTQHGVRMGKSCITNLLEFMDTALPVMDEGSAIYISLLISRRINFHIAD